MKVRVLYFAVLRERMKASEADCDVQEGENIAQLARRLFEGICEEKFLDKSLMYSANNAYVDADYCIQEGDEIAFIPPVAGG